MVFQFRKTYNLKTEIKTIFLKLIIEKPSNIPLNLLKKWTREFGCEFRVCVSLQIRLQNCEFSGSSPDSNPSLVKNLLIEIRNPKFK